MEKRWSLRKAVNFQVMLSYPKLGYLRVQSENLSMEGVFLDTGRIVLHRNTLVKVAFTAETNDKLMTHSLPAMVVHSSERGAGLMFKDIDTPTVHAIREMVYGPQAWQSQSQDCVTSYSV